MAGYYGLAGLKPGKKVPPIKTPASGTDAVGNPLSIEAFNDSNFGFVRMTVSPSALTAVFVTVDTTSGKTGIGDSFTLNFKANTVATGISKAAKKVSAKSKAAKSTKKAKKKTPNKRGGSKPKV
jgi:hypothetical protein